MRGPMTARKGGEGDVFARIGAFLSEQGLSPEPAHYSFAYSIITEPDGAIAQAVRRLTDGGVRLRRGDIESLGGTVVAGAPTGEPVQPRRPDISHADALEDNAARLVAETQAQVAGFTTIMQAMQDETRGFGRDLAESAAAIGTPQVIGHAGGLEEIARITGTMLARVRDAEARLASATHEAEALRAKLAEANDTARRDALTGLPNRRAFEEAFTARGERDGPYCLAVADIDRFKRINDIHGHPVGDRVLCAVGRLLVEECAGELVVRHGGEEFAILLRGKTLAQAAEHLDGVRAMMAAKRFRIRESDQPLGSVTLSIGVTAVQVGDDSAAAFDRADRLLYTAKAEGRDRVCAA
ncbi:MULTISPECIES: GGDEF domain-containing protein [unclassified Sphingomonas]|jgi:diguanylate cyclase|uniref:GGDEF domain-containing protein n=1 Tax=unclassified Sphingomonas TaxID=196159 RepID=UPI000E100F28|nr:MULTISPECIES: GGDEF domain-containing protein [unclassified Sphingomonas]AXJ95381.1 GGDEF domain-containing protein [Sphingomonas sp. FARSPH]